MVLNGVISQVSSRDNMGEVAVVLVTGLFTFGEMHFEEAAMLSSELMERVKSFDDTGSFGPAASHSGGQCYDRNATVAECIATE